MNLQRFTLILFFLLALLLSSCSVLAPAPGTASPSGLLAYDAPVSLAVRKGSLLPGTTISYNGKTQTGAAGLVLAGMLAVKQVGDSLDWQGTLVPNTTVKLNTRVVSFDDQAVNLVGSAHIEVANSIVQPGGSSGAAIMQFSAPVTYSIVKGQRVPGSNVSYIGSATEGAQFGGIEGYSYRKLLDSLQYTGRVNPKVYVKLDLRVLNYSTESALLGGVADLTLEQ